MNIYIYRTHRLWPPRPCDGELRAGLSCLIGPSGAGKSTLLGLLAGRKSCGRAEGVVSLDGAVVDAAARRAHIGYVTQAVSSNQRVVARW